MKKKIIMKGILLTIILAILALGFGGCGAVIITPSTGTVYITVDTWDDYYISVDGIGQGYTDWTGYFTIYNVPVGYYDFEAFGYYHGYYGTVTNRYIHSGANYITIYTY